MSFTSHEPPLLTTWTGRIALFVALVLLLGSASGYATRDIQLATGGSPEGSALLPHIAAFGLWLGLLWIWLEARHRAVRVPRLPAWGRGVLELVLIGSYARVSVEITFACFGGAFDAPPFPPEVTSDDLRPMMRLRAVMMYLLALAASTAFAGETRRRQSEAETRALLLQQETLERQLSQARLKVLRSQLHPHFLFNALHVIGGVILSGKRAEAHRALASLSTLLRESLRQGENPTSSLEDELDLVGRYVDLTRLRFGPRIGFEVDVPPDLLGASVPSLVLLPLVENSVTHGLEPLERGGTIGVSARSRGDSLELTVGDNGIGRPADARSSAPGHGIGLGDTVRRLEALHGSAAGVRVDDRASGGTLVTLTLPLQKGLRARRQGAAS